MYYCDYYCDYDYLSVTVFVMYYCDYLLLLLLRLLVLPPAGSSTDSALDPSQLLRDVVDPALQPIMEKLNDCCVHLNRTFKQVLR